MYYGAESQLDDARVKTLPWVIDHNISTVTVNTKWCNALCSESGIIYFLAGKDPPRYCHYHRMLFICGWQEA